MSHISDARREQERVQNYQADQILILNQTIDQLRREIDEQRATDVRLRNESITIQTKSERWTYFSLFLVFLFLAFYFGVHKMEKGQMILYSQHLEQIIQTITTENLILKEERKVNAALNSRQQINDTRASFHFQNVQQLVQLAIKTDHFPNLTRITSATKSMNDHQLKLLVYYADKFPNLEYLSFRKNNVTSDGLKTLVINAEKLPNLHTLYFGENQITDEGLKTLVLNAEKLPNLHTLSLWGNIITDEGLKALALNAEKLPNLNYLYIGGNQITDEGLKILASNGKKFPKLSSLDLQYTKITENGLKIFDASRQNFAKLRQFRA